MSKKTLLLDSTYQVLAFIPERKAFKLMCKEDRVEALANWDDIIKWGDTQIFHPSILKLTYPIKRNYKNTNFSRKAVVKRDKSTCQYCGQKLSASEITMDHVLPKAKGGITSFTNCVVSCKPCNGLKADKTPEQANMVLLKRPAHPSFIDHFIVNSPEGYWHEEWSMYLS